jgi:hypothetical protein
VNHRICSFSKLKTLSLFKDFKFDELIDFKLKPPYIPETLDFNNKFNDSILFQEFLNVKY